MCTRTHKSVDTTVLIPFYSSATLSSQVVEEEPCQLCGGSFFIGGPDLHQPVIGGNELQRFLTTKNENHHPGTEDKAVWRYSMTVFHKTAAKRTYGI